MVFHLAVIQGNDIEAERAVRNAMHEAPLDLVPNFYAGSLALRQKDFTKAIQTLSYCLGKEPHAVCFLMRGEALEAIGKHDDALRDFDQAIQLSPELVPALEGRGNLLRNLGRDADAQADFDRVMKLRD